ncbi:MAG TPA: sigma-70 family RNA polymerase sigma factor [Pseudonocardiaceae bacterium]
MPSTAEAELDDATLVARAADGDVSAFERLVIRYQPSMYRLALRMLGDAGHAEDVVQEVFLATWRELPELRTGMALVARLYRMTTNRCLNALRSRRPTALESDSACSRRPDLKSERATETHGELAALTIALDGLTASQRACWLLREAHGRSYEEIAAILGTSSAAVRGRIARARAQLAEAMLSWR